MVRRVLVEGLLEIDEGYCQMGSTTSPLRVPVLTSAQRLALPTNSDGVLVYDSDLNAYYGLVGGVWAAVGSGSGGGPHTHSLADITDDGALASLNSVGTAELTDNAVTLAKLQDIASDRLLGRDTSTTGDPEQLIVSGGIEFTGTGGIQRSALSGDVSVAAGSSSTTIANDVVTNAKLANMAAGTIKGNNTGGVTDPSDLTAAQVAAMLPVVTSGAAGLAPASGGGTTNFLRADSTWAAPPAGGGGGPSTVKKTADQTFSNTTPTNVSGLSFAVTANTYYEFRFLVLFQSNTLTVGVGLAVTAPAVTRFGYTVRTIIAADGPGAEIQGAGTASGDAVLSTAVPAINTDYIAEVLGVVLPSANGTIQLQARNETGTTPVIVRQGSVGYLWSHGT